MTTVAGGAPRTIRRPGRNAIGATLFGVLDAYLVYAVVVTRTVTGTVIAALFLAAALYATVGMARSGVVVDHDGLIVRDAWRTRRIPWSQVLYISPPGDDRAFYAVGVVVRGTGRIRCNALGAMRYERNGVRRVGRLYRLLNAELEAARADGRCPSPE